METGNTTAVSKEVSVAAPGATATIDSIETAAETQNDVVHQLTESLKAKLASLTARLEQVKSTNASLEESNEGLAAKVTAQEGAQLALIAAQEEADRLKAELAQATTQAERNFDASRAAEAAQSEADRLREELELASTQAARNFDVTKDLEAQQQRVLPDIEALKNADTATVERLSAELRAREEADAAVIGKLESRVGQLTAEKVDARADASATRACLDALTAQMARLATERSALQHKLNAKPEFACRVAVAPRA